MVELCLQKVMLKSQPQHLEFVLSRSVMSNPCDPMGYNPPGTAVHGILQTRILEWVSVPFSRNLPDLGCEPGSPAFQADSLSSEQPGKASLVEPGNVTLFGNKK